MARFFKNRQTALILALAAALLTSPLLAGTGFAGSVDGGIKDPDQSPKDGKGDPDVPTGPARTNHPGAQRVFVIQPRETPTVGDGRVPNGAWVWRLRIVLRGLKAYTFRF